MGTSRLKLGQSLDQRVYNHYKCQMSFSGQTSVSSGTVGKDPQGRSVSR